ncbi:hypothetical protein BDR22DRAFT_297086 [Usnea florida]
MASSNTSGTYFSSAPSTSPSANQPSQYFPPYPQHRHQTSASLPQSQPATSQSQPQSQLQSQQQSQQQSGQAQQCGNDPSQSKSKDFCVIAEAAKRAQMACLMRDMGEVAL